jgi:enterochelin esterase-like enzyme
LRVVARCGDRSRDIQRGIGYRVTRRNVEADNIATRALFDQYHVKYTFVQGTGGHVWDTWRRNLRDFAPLLFR